jgi:iron complex outermembrane receptor protein
MFRNSDRVGTGSRFETTHARAWLSIFLIAVFVPLAPAAMRAQEGQEGYDEKWTGASTEAPLSIEEITVRARRRAELLEDVPISVTALTTSDLQAAQANNLEDIAAIVPNLTILSGRSGQDASVVVRGVGAFPFIFFDQGVGIYVDGVFLSRQQGSLLDIVDIEQLEVLRGPQGTLFGKNTIGGAISITTAKPKDDLEGYVSVRAGSFDTVETRSMLNIPIPWGWFEDRLFTRYSFGTANSKGYTRNRESGEYYSDKNAVNFYGSMRLEPMEDVHFNVSGQWSRDETSGLGGRCVVIQEDGFQVADLGLLPEGFFDACRRSEKFRFSSDQHPLSSNISYGAWGTLEWAPGARWGLDDLKLLYTGAWREQETRTKDDAEMTEFPFFALRSAGTTDPDGGFGQLNGNPGNAQQIQQELQVSGQVDDFSLFGTGLGAGGLLESWDLSFVGGVFGFWETANTDTNILFGSGISVLDAFGATTFNLVDTNNWDWAIFGQGILDLTDWMSITGGVRYTQEKKALKRLVYDALTVDPEPQVEFDLKDKFDGWTPTASLALTATDSVLDMTGGSLNHLMGYFTYARGFRGGGFNGNARTTEEGESFEPEFGDSFELGVKTAFWDRRISLSTAIYQVDRDDQQVPQLITPDCGEDLCLTQVFVRNAAKARGRGWELEVLATPIDGMRINSSVGFSESKFRDFPEAENALTGAAINRKGQQQAFTPEWQTSLGAQYTYDLPSWGHERFDGSITPRLDWYWESPVHNFAPEIPQLKQDAYHLLNLRIGYLFNEAQSEIAFWSKNLTDTEYFKNSLSWPRLTGTGIQYYEPPRSFGVEINHTFN